MIYVVEGPDGTGKSTLAKAIEAKVEGTIMHCGRRPGRMREYHRSILTAALWLDKLGIPVVLDRWAPSEQVYGSVFRGGSEYDVLPLMAVATKEGQIVPIYCWNEDASENHRANLEERHEYVGAEDYGKVLGAYSEFMRHNVWDWERYNFNINDLDEFVEGLPR